MIQRVAFVALVSMLASVAATAVVFYAVLGFDLDRTFTGRAVLQVAAILSISVPLVVGPIVSYRACVNIRETQFARDAFQRLSRIDELTGLPNRRGFDELALDRFAHAGDAAASALMVDIDCFKAFNDAFGHGFGDAALLHVANILRSATAGTPVVLGRQGGDEFVVALPGVGLDAATALAERIRRICAAHPVVVEGHSQHVRLSIGVAAAPDGRTSLTRLMSQADAALLAAKRDGRNRVIGLDARDTAPADALIGA